MICANTCDGELGWGMNKVIFLDFDHTCVFSGIFLRHRMDGQGLLCAGRVTWYTVVVVFWKLQVDNGLLGGLQVCQLDYRFVRCYGQWWENIEQNYNSTRHIANPHITTVPDLAHPHIYISTADKVNLLPNLSVYELNLLS